jgi:hypothetical protein
MIHEAIFIPNECPIRGLLKYGNTTVAMFILYHNILRQSYIFVSLAGQKFGSRDYDHNMSNI